MNPEAEAELNRIQVKEPAALTAGEADFLRARVAYLGRRARERFADVLKGKETNQEKAAREAVEAQEDKMKQEEETAQANQHPSDNDGEDEVK